ncbi:unnamed protein product [Cuscuta epithymum]|uniref:Uncharacterized protein n=1 Tax=Cuscuta epithymum TaxID=186058 RepID=A0AAV0D3T4_9ASTE|nr:unnamed protein product [Cuscuta epithymum]
MHKAINEMNGSELDGRNITVNEAQSRGSGGGGGGGYGGGRREGGGGGYGGGYGGGRRDAGYGGGRREGGDRGYGGGGGGYCHAPDLPDTSTTRRTVRIVNRSPTHPYYTRRLEYHSHIVHP